ncbi:hypothetical protein SERIO_v1c03220 [Spiroplasma eriocheiris]|uniref:Uncharacterized protein n=1 Tax=Spiroplasma eriocheiris TaxID=315358 RepID=A0A0H3XKH0_9MOLU|nr:hypothetical protein SERIO_v1c03220 [Spiroplasma eriocheiris]
MKSLIAILGSIGLISSGVPPINYVWKKWYYIRK